MCRRFAARLLFPLVQRGLTPTPNAISPLRGWAAQRRQDLLALLSSLNQQIEQLDQAAATAAAEHETTRLLMTQPGVGPITALAFAVTIGDATRFQRGKQVASYLGLIPREYSSGGRQQLGSISKQGNRFLRMLLVEAVQNVVRLDEGFRNSTGIAAIAWPKA